MPAPANMNTGTMVNVATIDHERPAAPQADAARPQSPRIARTGREPRWLACLLGCLLVWRGASIGAAAPPPANGERPRTWTDSTGQHSVVAIYVSSDTETVRLWRQEDHREIEVPIERLSTDDRARVQGLRLRALRRQTTEEIASLPTQRPAAAQQAQKPSNDQRSAISSPVSSAPVKLDPVPATKEIDGLLQAFGAHDTRAFMASAKTVENALLRGDGAGDVAGDLLYRRQKFIPDGEVSQFAALASKEESPSVAARLVLQIAMERFSAPSSGGGRLVVGRLLLEGGAEPKMVVSQTPILPSGYFATTAGDLSRPLCFRAPGCKNLDLSLPAKSGDSICVGSVRMAPTPIAERASLAAKVVLDGGGSPATAVVRLIQEPGPANTPNNRPVSMRQPQPEPVVVPVTRTGEFVAEGLAPGEYRLVITEPDHVMSSETKTLASGRRSDLGEFRLLSMDPGVYIGRPAPASPELAWEKDYQIALARARSERKPMLIMMTATWCGYCKLLEQKTLNDPWIRQFLSEFVVVKAFEDKEVERAYGAGGYPTLAFATSDGQLAHKSIGFKPPLAFCEECRQAFEKLKLPTPPDLQLLVDKQVLARAVKK